MTSKLWLYKAKDANCKDNIARKTELVDIRKKSDDYKKDVRKLIINIIENELLKIIHENN